MRALRLHAGPAARLHIERHGDPVRDNSVMLAPDPNWVARLPNGKVPDRSDFPHYGTDLKARMRAWGAAVEASRQLADEFAEWCALPPGGQAGKLEAL